MEKEKKPLTHKDMLKDLSKRREIAKKANSKKKVTRAS